MLKRNVLGRAAFGWHVSGVRHRHCKYAAQAVMAHPVHTCEFGGFHDWYVIRATGQTGHFLKTQLSSRRSPKQARKQT